MLHARRALACSRRALGVVLATVAGVVAVGAGPTPARAQSGCAGNHALIVVDTGSAVHETEVCWSGTISGLAALQLAGANPVALGYGGLGAAVCQLYGVGNPATNPACLEGPGGAYWAYFRAAPGATGWSVSSAGASTTTVANGSMEGWKYGTGARPPFPCYDGNFGCPPPSTPPTVPPTNPPSASGSAAIPGAATPTSEPATGSSGAPSGAAAGAAPGATPTTASNGDGSGAPTTLPARAGGAVTQRTANPPAPGTGSPVGVIVAGTVLAGALGSGVVLRRRNRAPRT